MKWLERDKYWAESPCGNFHLVKDGDGLYVLFARCEKGPYNFSGFTPVKCSRNYADIKKKLGSG